MRKISWLLVVGALSLYGCGVTSNPAAPSGESDSATEEVSAETDNEASEEIVESLERDAFNGYWANEALAVVLKDKTLFLQDLETEYIHSYALLDEEIAENTITLSISHAKEEESVSYFEGVNELSLTLDNDQLTSSSFTLDRSTEENFSEPFLAFVETDGLVGRPYYQGPDLTMEDFSGFWVPIDKYHYNDDVRTDLGNYYVWIDEHVMQTGFHQSTLMSAPLLNYEIKGNSLYTEEEIWMQEAFDAYEYGHADFIEREVIHSKYTLFPEENDRDRLVLHATGLILQRASLEEMMEHFYLEAEYYAEGAKATGLDLINVLNELDEDQYKVNERNIIDESVQVENYPYSIGDLSEAQLYEEYQVIQGEIPPLEETVDVDVAISQLLNGAFESTPSFEHRAIDEDGYYFGGGLDTVMTYGFGGRTSWYSGPLSLMVTNVTYEHPIYTVHFEDPQSMSTETQRFFRINENVIYPENDAGGFTKRYEQHTDWNNFHGLP